jgi:hypothetical protein
MMAKEVLGSLHEHQQILKMARNILRGCDVPVGLELPLVGASSHNHRGTLRMFFLAVNPLARHTIGLSVTPEVKAHRTSAPRMASAAGMITRAAFDAAKAAAVEQKAAKAAHP